MQKFGRKRATRNYREALARERARTLSEFIAKVLAREAAKEERPLSPAWIVRPPRAPLFKDLCDIFLVSSPPRHGEGPE
jgi:hypothetical protein